MRISPTPKSTPKPPLKIFYSYECYLCKTTFKNEPELRMHIQGHVHKEIPYEKRPKQQKKQKRLRPQLKNCFICDERLTTDQLVTHSCLASSEIVCEYCSTPFELLDQLKEHLANEHSNAEKLVYICDICRSPFPMRSLMDCHKKYHKSGCYSCKKCNKTFDTVLQKQKHLINDHVTNSKSSLITHHLLSHITFIFDFFLNITDYLCDECGRSFKSDSGLRTHKHAHTGLKVYCTKCPYSTSSKGVLRRHMARHQTGTSKFSCHLCNKKFDTSITLYKHLGQ